MKEFMEPWMVRCNQSLILRFWRSKGSPGKLTMEKYGLKVIFIGTVIGELCIKQSDIFKQLYGDHYVKKLNGGDYEH